MRDLTDEERDLVIDMAIRAETRYGITLKRLVVAPVPVWAKQHSPSCCGHQDGFEELSGTVVGPYCDIHVETEWNGEDA